MSKSAALEANALYNKYRPRTLSEVIGQEHLTEPLRNAILNGKVHHAYLFSGPAGCGKTSTARILAASLLCAEGPTPDPCGVCEFCVGIANESCMDVKEIDAASNGSVEDTRDLRDKAHYAPVSARFKIYIIDEAHMVTQAGFNALLKLVEEPPDYVKFIFATTEPEKVLDTIKSRTYNYQVRLVPPKTLAAHLADVISREGGSVEDGALPQIVKEARGQVRNGLGLVGQLLAGAPAGGLITVKAVSDLLGAVSEDVLDAVVNALVERKIEQIIPALGAALDEGADAKRLGEELLDRLRDLLVLVETGRPPALAGAASPDRVAKWTYQAKALGVRGLTTAGEVLQAALVTIRSGAGARVALELACSRMMISLVDNTDIPASLAQVRSALAGLMKQINGTVPALVPTPAVPAPAEPFTAPVAPVVAPTPPAQAAADPVPQADPQSQPEPVESTTVELIEDEPEAPAAEPSTPPADDDPWGPPPAADTAVTDGVEADDPWAVQGTPAPVGAPTGDHAATWEQIIAAVATRRRATSVLLGGAELDAVADGKVTVRFPSEPMANTMRDPRHADVLTEVVKAVLGQTWQIAVTSGAKA